MNKYQKNSGFSLVEMMVTMVILAGLASAIAPQLIQQQAPLAQAKAARDDITKIKAAANSYYMENMAWPSSVNELISLNYLPGDGLSPFGTGYQLRSDGNNLVVSVDTNRKQLANMLAGMVSYGKISGSSNDVVSSEMGTPMREAVESFYLARKVIDGCDDCNTLADGTNLDINGNDLNNIGTADIETANINDATIERGTVTDLDVNTMHFGSNSITYSGNTLQFNAPVVSVNGQLSLNGDINANGHDLLGFGRVQGEEASFNQLTAANGTVTQLSGDSLDYSNGQITTLTGNSLNYGSGTISSLQGNILTYGSGTVGSLTGSTLNYGAGSIGTLTGNTLNYANGTVDSLTGNSLNYSTGTFGTVIGTNGRYSSLNVSGYASLNSVGASSADITSLTGQRANVNRGEFNSVRSSSLSATTATINTVDATRINTDFLTTGTFNANSVNINGSFSVGSTLTANNVNVTNRTTTNSLQSSSSSLGAANSASLNVSGQVTSNAANVTTLTASNGSISQLTGSQANFNTVTANQFNGGTFRGTNFTTSQSSVNNNKSLIDQYISQWNSCKNAGGCK